RGVPRFGFTSFEALHASYAARFPGARALAAVPANAGRFYLAEGLDDAGALRTGADLAARAEAGVTVIAPEVTPALHAAAEGFSGIWTPGDAWDAIAIARQARARGRGADKPVYLQLSAAEEKFG